MTKQIHEYGASDSPTFGSGIHRNATDGTWKPIFPHEIGRALKHAEADYNYKMLSTTIVSYRIFPGGQIPTNFTESSAEDFSSDEGKFLTLKKDGTSFYWTLEEVIIPGGNPTYNSGLDPNIEMVEDLGGLEEGTTVSELSDGVTTISELLDKILFPTTFPQVDENPSASLTTNKSTLQKVKTNLTDLRITPSADRGKIELNDVFQTKLAGKLLSGTISGPSLPSTPLDITILDDHQPAISYEEITHEITKGIQTWNLNVIFDHGPMPIDSTGTDFPDIQYSTGVANATRSLEGVYPIFIGDASGNFIEIPLKSHLTTNSIILDQYFQSSELTPAWHKISIPVDLLTKNGTVNERYPTVYVYNTVSGNYDPIINQLQAWTDIYENRTINGESVQYRTISHVVQGNGNSYEIKLI